MPADGYVILSALVNEKGGVDEVAVIDPGPDDRGHVDAIVGAAGADRIRWVLLTHTHLDHWPAATRLALRTGARVLAFIGGNDHFFLNLSMAAAKLRLDAAVEGLQITDVTEASDYSSKLKEGMVVTRINSDPVTDLSKAKKSLQKGINRFYVSVAGRITVIAIVQESPPA